MICRALKKPRLKQNTKKASIIWGAFCFICTIRNKTPAPGVVYKIF